MRDEDEDGELAHSDMIYSRLRIGDGANVGKYPADKHVMGRRVRK